MFSRSLLTTAVFLFCAQALAAPATPPVKADLDGDGSPESAVVEGKAGGNSFTLSVKGTSLTVKMEFPGDEYQLDVVDLDSSDKWKELAVSTGQVDSEHRVYLVGYDGKKLRELGRVPALTEARGNGIILSDSWRGFWNAREKYVLKRAEWTLARVPQEFYFVGVEATVKQSFPLTLRREGKDVVANLAKDSRIQVLLCAPALHEGQRPAYLVKSSTGLVGWTTFEELETKTEGLPFAG